MTPKTADRCYNEGKHKFRELTFFCFVFVFFVLLFNLTSYYLILFIFNRKRN